MIKSLPRWLTSTNYTLSSRPPLKVDELEGDGTALNTAKRRPSQRFKVVKRSSKRLKEAEEWVEYIQEKLRKS